MAKRRTKSAPANDKFKIPGPDEYNQPSDNLLDYTICIYGTKGIGKTTLCSTIPGSLVFMTEPLRKNLVIRQQTLPVFSSPVIQEDAEKDAWGNLKQYYLPQVFEDDATQVVVFDTVDRLYESCVYHHSAAEGLDDPGEVNDYGLLWRRIKADFEETLTNIREHDKGLVFVSHAKESSHELSTGAKRKEYGPSTSAACMAYIKAACDFAFFYGYHGKQRCLHLRGFEGIWTSVGVENTYYSPNGNPIELFEVEDPTQGFKLLEDGFANKLYSLDEEPQTTVSTRRRKKS